MARLRASESTEPSDNASLYRESSVLTARQSVDSPRAYTPQTTTSENKENEDSLRRPRKSMPPPALPTANSDNALRAAKRRRLTEGDSLGSYDGSNESNEPRQTQNFDPDQDIEERRHLRKSFRELEKETTDKKTEWMDPNSTGLREAITRADHFFSNVKQTSDATLDSRILVAAGDLTHKKAQQTVLGDGAQGIDVDDFVTKCIAFMRQADSNEEHVRSGRTSTQRRRRTTQADSDDEDGPDDGDALNWDWLGSHACFLANKRPPVPSFLLGPLSLQKRTRAQRTRRDLRATQAEATKPQELKASDLEKVENSNLLFQCSNIHKQLQEIVTLGAAEAEAEANELGEDITEEEEKAIMDKHGLADDGGVSLFNFAINPESFGQTVENLFYVSFLIRDGMVGISEDSTGMPTLHDTEPNLNDSNRSRDTQRHQAVFTLDYDMWKELTEVLSIKKSIIPTREDDSAANNVSTTGWYA